MKHDSPDLFRVSPVSDMQELLNMQIQQTLPHNDENGSLVHVFRVRKSRNFIFKNVKIQFFSLISNNCHF